MATVEHVAGTVPPAFESVIAPLTYILVVKFFLKLQLTFTCNHLPGAAMNTTTWQNL